MSNHSLHIRGLNGLRALAVSLVLLRHNFHLSRLEWNQATFIPSVGPLELNHFFLNGWLGVDLFFVLSGFLISRPFFRAQAGAFSFKIYSLKRVLRIIPAYYSVLFLILLGAFPFYQFDNINIWTQSIYHLFFLQDYFPSDINVVFWSLAVEEKFYLLVPLGYLILRNAPHKNYTVYLILLPMVFSALMRYLAIAGTDSNVSYNEFFLHARAPFHACMEPLVLGVLLGHWEHKGIKPLPPSATFGFALIGLLSLMVSHEMMNTIGYFDIIAQPILIALFMAGLVYGVVFGVRWRVLENAVTDYLAKISYSLYLVHWPLFPLVVKIIDLFEITSTWSFLLSSLTYLAISIIVATAHYYLVELPFLRIKDRLN